MKRIVIVGAGFAGTWSALSAARLLDQHGTGPSEVGVTVIAPRASLDLRPRFYEPNVAAMTSPLGPLFDAVGVKFVTGTAEAIDPAARTVHFVDPEGHRDTLGYDRLILAAGSHLVRPDVPGLSQHTFSIDQLDDAARFEAHLHSLATRPNSSARNTIVVVGGGFTGIEIAAELPARLRAILDEDSDVRVVIIEQADVLVKNGAQPADHHQGASIARC